MKPFRAWWYAQLVVEAASMSRCHWNIARSYQALNKETPSA